MTNSHHFVALADIHASLEAFRAIVKHALALYGGAGSSEIWFLGDLFGRGPDPVTVWRRFRELSPSFSVLGNHDLGLLSRNQNIMIGGQWDGDYRSDDWEVILQHRAILEEMKLLDLDEGGRPIGGAVYDDIAEWPILQTPRPGTVMVHGGREAPFNPDETRFAHALTWDYVKNEAHFRHTYDMIDWLMRHPEALGAASQPVYREPPKWILVGHYHQRKLMLKRGDQYKTWPIELDKTYDFALADGDAVLVAPGGVGFPREYNDRLASYAVLEERDGTIHSVTFHGIPFDRKETQRKMRQERIPGKLVAYLNDPGQGQA